ncbi:efflux RND transporter periplasmic adaptor subunit [Massilia sp. W12]|uniref:efflux RND transporter periplasmic adaptor subunit n=1 Tax=Massilia sp. W12 TaxID=3126507 RepID=UPI0030D57F18
MKTKLCLLASLGMVAAPISAAAVFDCLIEPAQTVDIASPVTGLLEKVHVKRGERISQGQVLASLEARAESAATALALYKSQMQGPGKSAESKLEFAKKKFTRKRDMQSSNYLSAQERDDAEGEMKQAEAEVLLAKENREQAKLEWQQQSSLLNLRTIRSPFSGVVTDQLLYPGEIVEPSSGSQKKPILRIAQIDPLRIHVILPLAAFGKVKAGMKVQVSPEAPLTGQYSATVKLLDKVIDAASGSFAVYAEMPNPKHEIPSGVKCRADLPFTLDAPKK